MQTDYSVLVNTSDGFEDCWNPFFILLGKYWPELDAPVYLNTERKDWSRGGREIRCTQVQGEVAERLTWSQCLLGALAQIETPLVLYFQEDYFIHQPVRHDLVQAAVAHMTRNPDVKHIGLTKQGSAGPFEEAGEAWLGQIRQGARYRISTQAALWRVETLRGYLRAPENGWMFEIYGTWRARRRRETFLTARFGGEFGPAPIDYLHTGIVKGQWLPGIERVFSENGIKVDFSRRGFYQQKGVLARKFELARKLAAHPMYGLRQYLGLA